MTDLLESCGLSKPPPHPLTGGVVSIYQGAARTIPFSETRSHHARPRRGARTRPPPAAAGHQALFAGGCVRDRLLGHRRRTMTSPPPPCPPQVHRRFFPAPTRWARTSAWSSPNTAATTWKSPPSAPMAATATAGAPRPSRFPPRRRTRNGGISPSTDCLKCPETGEVIDYVGGLADLKAGSSAPSAIRWPASPRTACACCAPCASPRAGLHHRAGNRHGACANAPVC